MVSPGITVNLEQIQVFQKRGYSQLPRKSHRTPKTKKEKCWKCVFHNLAFISGAIFVGIPDKTCVFYCGCELDLSKFNCFEFVGKQNGLFTK